MTWFHFPTPESLASYLERIPYPVRLGKELVDAARNDGLVIVYGASDDLMEFEGAIRAEVDSYNGCTVLIDQDGLVPIREQAEAEGELEGWFLRKRRAMTLEAVWNPGQGLSWAYRTDIPHAEFRVVEGDEIYCRGIVFALADLQPSTEEKREVQAMLDLAPFDLGGDSPASRRAFCEQLVRHGYRSPQAAGREADDRASVCLAACEGVETEDFRGRTIGEYVAEQAFLSGMMPAANGVEIQLSGVACQLLAASFAGQFVGAGAKNYLEVNFQHRQVGPLTVTLQRLEGKTPGALAKEAQGELDSALTVLSDALSDADGDWRARAEQMLIRAGKTAPLASSSATADPAKPAPRRWPCKSFES
jgi:hypothetical protein